MNNLFRKTSMTNFHPIDVLVSGFRFLFDAKWLDIALDQQRVLIRREPKRRWVPHQRNPWKLGSPRGSSASSMVDKLSSTDLEFRSKNLSQRFSNDQGKTWPTFFGVKNVQLGGGFNPNWKICSSNWIILFRDQGKFSRYLKHVET